MLEASCVALLPGFPGLALAQSSFSAANHTSADYETFGIARPDSLSRAVRRRQAEFLAGRYCARLALRHVGGPRADIGVGPMRSPVWPSGYRGSITHTSDRAWATAGLSSRYSNVGIDAERLLGNSEAGLADIVLVDRGEQELLAQAMGDELRGLTLAFSVKESFFKAFSLDVGRYFDFHELAVVGVDTGREEITLSIVRGLGGALTAGCRFVGHYRWLGPALVLTWIIREATCDAAVQTAARGPCKSFV